MNKENLSLYIYYNNQIKFYMTKIKLFFKSIWILLKSIFTTLIDLGVITIFLILVLGMVIFLFAGLSGLKLSFKKLPKRIIEYFIK